MVWKYKLYIHFDKFDETYELNSPVFNICNLVVGDIYIDLSEYTNVVSLKRPNEACSVKFYPRGWFSKDNFKVAGEVFKTFGNSKEPYYTIEGNWND
jgi:hypothetical protein